MPRFIFVDKTFQTDIGFCRKYGVTLFFLFFFLSLIVTAKRQLFFAQKICDYDEIEFVANMLFHLFFPEATDQVEAYRGNIDIKRVNGMKWKKNRIRERRALWLAQ